MNLDKPRAKIMWSVDYTEEQECELGYTHKVDNVLVGLASKEEAEKEAKILKGKVTRHYHTPKITDEELKQLNDLGIPAERSVYGLTFKDLPVAISDSPNNLQELKNLYSNYKSTNRKG